MIIPAIMIDAIMVTKKNVRNCAAEAAICPYISTTGNGSLLKAYKRYFEK